MILVWAVLFVAAVPFAINQTDNLTRSGATVPGSQAKVVDEAIRDFPGAADDQQGVLLRASPGTPPAALGEATARVHRAVAGIEDLGLQSRRPRGMPQRLPDGLAFVPLTTRGGQDRRVDAMVELREELDLAGGPRDGVTAYIVGQDGLWAALNEIQKEELTSAETIGGPITLVILLLAFGALVAALLPLGLAAVTLTLTGAAVYFISREVAMSVFVTNMASMIGIGVAIDYSLFVLARYRQEIAAGHDEATARSNALKTSGTVVVFSGLTVIAALCGLFLVDAIVIRSIAIGMIVVVGFSILGAVTLVPALIDRFGSRIYGRSRRIDALKGRLRSIGSALVPGRAPGADDLWTRSTRRIMRRPLLTALAAAAFMLVLAIPALDMHMSQGALGQIPPDNEAREGAALAAKLTGPGRQRPLQELVVFRTGDASSPANRRAMAGYVESVRARPEVAAVDPPLSGRDPRQLLLTIVPRAPAETPPTRKLLHDLRAEAAAGEGIASVAKVDVGGASALPLDFATMLEDSLWKVFLFILVLSYLVLLLMLRSVLLPIKAVLMTALSVAAAYGVLVAVFQWGWLDGLVGYDSPGYVDAVVPMLMLAIVFGLSIDYEVFLLSRIREEMGSAPDTATAVARGLRVSGGTITSAAAIMVSVFAVFAAVGTPAVKQFGVGLAVAIALDATIVRLVLVPATMAVLGKWNWWLPPRLERLLPATAFERGPVSAAKPLT